MKVLTVSHGFPPDQMAGAEIYAWKISRGLKARGFDSVVFAPGSRPGHEEYEIVEEVVDDLRVLRLNNNFLDLYNLGQTYANPSIEDRFRAVLDQERPDVVHIHHTIGTTGNSTRLAKESGARVIVTLHDFWFHCARGQRLTPRNHLCEEVQPWRCSLCVGKKRIRYLLNYLGGYARGRTMEQQEESGATSALKFPFRLVSHVWNEMGTATIKRRSAVMSSSLDHADVILAPSQFIADRYIEEGTRAELVQLWPYGIDEGRFGDPSRPPAPRPEGPLRFGFVGTLLPSKGLDVLVEAFQEISPEQATLEIHGAAAGPNALAYDRRLKTKNKHAGLTFHGRFDNKRIVEILERFDVLIVPSIWYENAPLTLAEAVLARLAVITSDHGGMAELASGFQNALTFAPGDSQSLRAAMTKLIEDPTLVQSLKEKGAGVRTVADDIDALGDLIRVLCAPEADRAPGS